MLSWAAAVAWVVEIRNECRVLDDQEADAKFRVYTSQTIMTSE
jgi:hypothetical protein